MHPASPIPIYIKDDRKIRLFLSADLVGSTAFKEKHSSDSTQWTAFFDGFFRDFNTSFSSELDQVVKTRFEPSQRPQPWKLLGDELLLTATIEKPEDAVPLMLAFCRTIYECDANLQNLDKPRVKGTAWIAGFPVRNHEVRGLEIAGHPMPTDFIGPDMDIGFRLSAASRAGRVVVSLDLADVLTGSDDLWSGFDIRDVGWQNLKGVFGGHPYPIFWICERGRTKPHEAPWQEHECPLTFRANHEEIPKREVMQSLCDEVRAALRDLKLFKPYFREEDMPPAHREWWLQQDRLAQQAGINENLDVDDPFGDPEKTEQQN